MSVAHIAVWEQTESVDAAAWPSDCDVTTMHADTPVEHEYDIVVGVVVNVVVDVVVESLVDKIFNLFALATFATFSSNFCATSWEGSKLTPWLSASLK